MGRRVDRLEGPAVWWATARDVDPALLDVSVRDRLAAMHVADDRRRHATAALLGDVLARTHGGSGARVERTRGEAPRVVGANAPLHMSVAHAGHLVVVALAPCRVGVDVELDDADADADAVAAAMSSREHEAIAALPAHRRATGLLRTWVRKEAVLKAFGTGLARDPRTVELTSPDEEPSLLASPEQGVVTIRDLEGRPGSIAALAAVDGDVDEVDEHDGDVLLDVAAA